MNDTARVHRKRGNSVSCEAIGAQLLAEMSRIEEQIDSDRARGIRLREESQAIKAETEIIKARTAVILSQLTQIVNSLQEQNQNQMCHSK